jgi:hypothetical protein
MRLSGRGEARGCGAWLPGRPSGASRVHEHDVGLPLLRSLKRPMRHQEAQHYRDYQWYHDVPTNLRRCFLVLFSGVWIDDR